MRPHGRPHPREPHAIRPGLRLPGRRVEDGQGDGPVHHDRDGHQCGVRHGVTAERAHVQAAEQLGLRGHGHDQSRRGRDLHHRAHGQEGVRVSVSINVGAAGAMFFVAHEDDDLLFLNPDIAHAFADGRYIITVYFTAGSCTGDTGENAYYLDREAGVRAAYARLANVANEWTVIDQPVREVRLTAEPRISLVFFRLHASKSEAGNVCDLAATNLRGLFNDGVTDADIALTSLDEVHSYTRSQLFAAVTGPIRGGTRSRSRPSTTAASSRPEPTRRAG